MRKTELPVGAVEVADLLGVQVKTVHTWQYRGVFPPRDFTVNGLPAWRFATITTWAVQTGRLSPGQAAALPAPVPA